MYHIDKIPEPERADLIQKSLEEKDSWFEHTTIPPTVGELIDQAPEENRLDLIRQALKDENTSVRRSAIERIEEIQDIQERADLIQVNTELNQQWKMLAQSTSLYKDFRNPFFHKPFVKTGSGITLLDKVPGIKDQSLREKVIIRHIDVGPYQGWKRAYEDVEFWKAQGFDYVPVEPIVKTSLNPQTYRVDVVTRVLVGPSVTVWTLDTGLYVDVIRQQVEKIENALKIRGIVHGHTHGGNFIVSFDRDEQGEPILEKLPRVYVIDFDQAVSVE